MNFNQGGFKSIVKKRPYYLKTMLNKYNCLIYTDIDTVWLKDPRPFFVGDYDFWAQIDGLLSGGQKIEYVYRLDMCLQSCVIKSYISLFHLLF